MSKPKKVLIVGAGVTGALTSLLLKRAFNDRLRIEIWDKGRGIGGRMATTRMIKDAHLSCDLGLQYITVTPTHWERHQSIYEELLSQNRIAPLQKEVLNMKDYIDGTRHFVAPHGSSSIPKYFINQAGCSVRQHTHLDSLRVAATQFQVCATNTTTNEPIVEHHDIVVVTMPVPQLFNLSGDMEAMLTPFRSSLQKIAYTSRYALGLFFPGFTSLPDVDWSAKYVYDNECIRFVAIDTEKRNQDSTVGLSMVVHASVPFSMKHLEGSVDEVQPLILSHLREVIPNLPEADVIKTQRWRYSQVSTPYHGEPGCITVNNLPLLICSGDGFTHSGFDNCMTAACSVLDKIAEVLKLETDN